MIPWRMTPDPDTPDPDDDLNVELFAWLDDPNPEPPDGNLPPAAGFRIVERARAFMAHRGYPPEDRAFTYLIRVIGTDDVPTLQYVTPEHNVHMLLHLMSQDDELMVAAVVGKDYGEETPEPEALEPDRPVPEVVPVAVLAPPQTPDRPSWLARLISYWRHQR